MSKEEAKKHYKVVIEYTNWTDRLFGAYYLLFKGWAGSNGQIILDYKRKNL